MVCWARPSSPLPPLPRYHGIMERTSQYPGEPIFLSSVQLIERYSTFLTMLHCSRRGNEEKYCSSESIFDRVCCLLVDLLADPPSRRDKRGSRRLLSAKTPSRYFLSPPPPTLMVLFPVCTYLNFFFNKLFSFEIGTFGYLLQHFFTSLVLSFVGGW